MARRALVLDDATRSLRLAPLRQTDLSLELVSVGLGGRRARLVARFTQRLVDTLGDTCVGRVVWIWSGPTGSSDAHAAPLRGFEPAC